MSKRGKNKDIVVETILLGICVVAVYMAAKKPTPPEKSSTSSLGKIVTHLGELLTTDNVDRTPFTHDMEKKVHQHEDTISTVLDLISSGLHLWDKFKKG